jgi:uncharacterized protein
LENENSQPQQSLNNQPPANVPLIPASEPETSEVRSEVPPQRSGVWTFWPTIGFSSAILAINFFAQILVTLVFTIIYIIQQYSTYSDLDLLRTVKDLMTNGLLLSFASIISAIAGVAAIILFIKIRKGISVSEYLGLKAFNRKTLIFIIGLGIVLIIASGYLDRILPKSPNTDFTIDAYNTSIWPVLLGIAVVIFAPLFEEGFFRGFLFVGLEQTRLGGVGTILITSAGWAALHVQYDIYGILSIFVLGIVLGIVRLKTGSLWSVLILHGLWNLAAIVATALYVNGTGT